MSVKSATKLATFRWVCSALSPLVEANVLRDSLSQIKLDWNYVVSIASAHLVLPELHLALQKKELIELVPVQFSEALEGFFVLNALHNKQLRDQMLSVTKILNKASIFPIWLKGATNLLENNWETSGRMMLDLDFWIPNIKDQQIALMCLEEAGYVLQDDYKDIDYIQSQHFAPRIKEGEAARIEIHRTIVSTYAAPLLPDSHALQMVEWITWENLHVGRLNALDRLMHSYIQCTEMNASMNDLNQGRIPLMKIVDFLQRYEACEIDNFLPEFFEQLEYSPWQLNAQRFFSFLTRDFGMPLLLKYDANFLRWMDLRIKFPTSIRNLHILNRVCRKICSGHAGSPRYWWSKLNRYVKTLPKRGAGL